MSDTSGPAANPRRLAVNALRAWEDGHRHADDILSALSKKQQLSPPDHALLQQLFYGVIRSLSRLDALVDKLRRGKLSRENRNLLRLGLFQLFDTRMPAHAAVNETVNLARHKRDRSVINGVLRSAERQRQELVSFIASQPLSIRQSHPDFLLQRWTDQWGSDVAASLCEWNNQPPAVYLRINRLLEKESTDEVMEKIHRTIADHEKTTPLPDHPDFFQIEGPVPKEWIQRGWIYLQDPSTSLSCRLLDAGDGEQILDACAAPGGKTSLLASSGAHITAVDRGESRLSRLYENLTRLRSEHLVEVHDLDWNLDNVAPREWQQKFDAILLDVPCSNTGVMRRRADVRWRLTGQDFIIQPEQQLRIVDAVLPLLKPGGHIVYSTCSLDTAENSDVIDTILARHPQLTREQQVDSLPWRDGFDGAFACRLRLAAP